MSVCAEIFVSGRVQGVNYRAFTREAGRRLGLVGFCRNLPDGRVEVRVEGERDRIDDFIAELRNGPPAADVEEVRVNWVPADQHFPDFCIRY